MTEFGGTAGSTLMSRKSTFVIFPVFEQERLLEMEGSAPGTNVSCFDTGSLMALYFIQSHQATNL